MDYGKITNTWKKEQEKHKWKIFDKQIFQINAVPLFTKTKNIERYLEIGFVTRIYIFDKNFDFK